MIQFSEQLRDFLSRGSVSGFYLVRVGDSYMTTYYQDVTHGGNVYTKDCPIVSIQPPQQSASVDSQKYAISFADPAFEMGFLSETGIIGKRVEVHLCIINPDTNQPLLTDLITVYKGTVSDTAYKIETGMLGSSIYQLTCGSPMANLDMTKSFMGNKTFIRSRIDPLDSAFDQVYEGGSKIRLRWGKT